MNVKTKKRYVDVTEGRESINPETGKRYSHTLSKNTEKVGENEPDYRGRVHLMLTPELLSIIERNNGKITCSLSGWERDGKYGKFLSLQLQHAVESPESGGGEGVGTNSEEF